MGKGCRVWTGRGMRIYLSVFTYVSSTLECSCGCVTWVCVPSIVAGVLLQDTPTTACTSLRRLHPPLCNGASCCCTAWATPHTYGEVCMSVRVRSMLLNQSAGVRSLLTVFADAYEFCFDGIDCCVLALRTCMYTHKHILCCARVYAQT